MGGVNKVLAAIGDAGTAVDWWFAYKLPKGARPSAGNTKPGAKTTGYEYYYADDRATKPAMLTHVMNDRAGAWFDTLAQIFPAKGEAAATTGWVLYNDEAGGHKSGNNSRLGHTKGVLAYDTASDTAFWLLHSTPCTPKADDPEFTPDEEIYGQTFLCITLKDVATARAIAAGMCKYQQPETYDCRIAAGLPANDALALATGKMNTSLPAASTDYTIQSKAGAAFRVFAKNRLWNQDLWTDLVGPGLGLNLAVETWRRGALFGTQDSDKKDDVEDVLDIDLSRAGGAWWWPYTADHAKWAASEDKTKPWVCVADINRQTTQARRGGGAVCFLQPDIWQWLVTIEVTHPAGAEFAALPASVTHGKPAPASTTDQQLAAKPAATPPKAAPPKAAPPKAAPQKQALTRKAPTKTSLKKPSGRKSPSKKSPPQTAASNKPASSKAPSKNAPPRKPQARTSAPRKTSSRKAAARSSGTKKAPAKRAPSKREPTKRAPAKKSPAKRAPSKRTPAKRAPSRGR